MQHLPKVNTEQLASAFVLTNAHFSGMCVYSNIDVNLPLTFAMNQAQTSIKALEEEKL